MINENALIIYKTKPAVVKERSGDKYLITLADGEKIKVREKDIEFLHPGPVSNPGAVMNQKINASVIREAWELLSGDNDARSPEKAAARALKDIALFIFNDYTPASAYFVYELLKDGLYFSGTIEAVTPRSREEVESGELKRGGKLRESDERGQFLKRLNAAYKKPAENKLSDGDARFMQDVEALARGRTQRSRTMKEMGLRETPEDAHSLLLKTGVWTRMVNPHPDRFGLSRNNPRCSDSERAALEEIKRGIPLSCSAENSGSRDPRRDLRRDLRHLAAFAIDSPWSGDPDDAVSIEETKDGKTILYVHVADPASVISFNSAAEKEARGRGCTLYLPEGAVRMLAEEYIPVFALGMSGTSAALTFKITAGDNAEITDTEIFPSLVNVTRLTYEEADRGMENNAEGFSPLCRLSDLAGRIYSRRAADGAVNIELPDVHITAVNDTVNIELVEKHRSSSLVKECMIAAGEGAGQWAASRGLAFPYISQEVEAAGKLPEGLAGSAQLRRCMRQRVLSVKPGRHEGLGIETYTQVTSPLRRYTDLLAHIQIYAYLRGEKPVPQDDITMCLGFGEAAVSAAVHAERASENHWKMVYLADKKDSLWDAAAIENKGRAWHVLIPSLALETQVALRGNITPNDKITLILKSVNIAKGEAELVAAT